MEKVMSVKLKWLEAEKRKRPLKKRRDNYFISFIIFLNILFVILYSPVPFLVNE